MGSDQGCCMTAATVEAPGPASSIDHHAFPLAYLMLRRDLEQLEMWAFAVAASRTAGVRPPLALPFSNTWLPPGRHLDDAERVAVTRAVRVNFGRHTAARGSRSPVTAVRGSGRPVSQ